MPRFKLDRRTVIKGAGTHCHRAALVGGDGHRATRERANGGGTRSSDF